jgi:hypothetical protein
MRNLIIAAAAATALIMSAPSAWALCAYGPTLYAKTTLAQEFGDSELVIRGRVLSAADVRGHPNDEWGTLYRVRVNDTFKGASHTQVRDFTLRNSGGFYLDPGADYLLFLDRLPRRMWPRTAAAPDLGPALVKVNYNCGQSRLWSEVSTGDRKALRRLALRSRRPG